MIINDRIFSFDSLSKRKRIFWCPIEIFRILKIHHQISCEYVLFRERNISLIGMLIQ